MRAGKMRHRIVIQSITKSQGTSGEITNTWATFAEVYASIEPIAGREFFAANQVQSNVTTRFRIRYLSGVTANMRVLSDSVYYDIEAVIPDSKSGIEWMQLMCVLRGAEGFRNG